MSGFTDTLVRGVCSFAADHAVGEWDATDTTPIETMTRPIVLGALPDQPDTGIGVIAYDPAATPRVGDVVVGVQFYVRSLDGDTDGGDIGDALYEAFHAASDLVIGGIPVALVYRFNIAPMGVDELGRRQNAHNYYFEAARPTAARTY